MTLLSAVELICGSQRHLTAAFPRRMRSGLHTISQLFLLIMLHRITTDNIRCRSVPRSLQEGFSVVQGALCHQIHHPTLTRHNLSNHPISREPELHRTPNSLVQTWIRNNSKRIDNHVRSNANRHVINIKTITLMCLDSPADLISLIRTPVTFPQGRRHKLHLDQHRTIRTKVISTYLP